MLRRMVNVQALMLVVEVEMLIGVQRPNHRILDQIVGLCRVASQEAGKGTQVGDDVQELLLERRGAPTVTWLRG